ncbi:MAG TPA: ACP synthase [Polyangia bacterium]|nr:ACP synthase [Polyangia bacterium]
MTSETHIQELALRRFFAGELGDADRPPIETHTAGCARCRARLKEIGDEQRRFEQDISFDRFAAGVERAARTPRRVPPQRSAGARWAFPALGLAAALALTIGIAPRLRTGGSGGSATRETNRIKSGSGITVQIAGAGAGPQRAAAVDTPETLSPGERIRIGYQPGTHRYLTSLSIDDRGEVTALYPEAGRSLPVGTGAAATRYLPDSVEFTGRGDELLIVVLGDQPLDVDAVKKAARAAYQKAGGDLARLPSLELPGEQFHRLFVKP